MKNQENNIVPLVSVYVLTYNHSKYLRECLDGIVNQQTSFPFEIIVVDDCSTDNTCEILHEYDKLYPGLFRLVLLEENWYSKKLSKTSRIALPMARGKYLAICEGDDYWTYPLKLQRLADGLEMNPDYSCFFHSFKIQNETNDARLTYSPQFPQERDADFHDILVNYKMHTASCMMRLDNLRPFEQLTHIMEEGNMSPYMDILLFAILLTKGKIHGIPDKWSVYRIHQNGIWTQERLAGNEDSLRTESFDKLATNLPEEYGWLPLHLKTISLLKKSSENIQNRKYLKGFYKKIHAFLARPKSFYIMYARKYLPKFYFKERWKRPESR